MVGEIIPWVIWWVHVRLLLLLRGNLKSIATVLKVWWRLLLLHILLLLILLNSHFIWIHLFTFPSPFSHIIGLDWFLGCDLVSRIRRNSEENIEKSIRREKKVSEFTFHENDLVLTFLRLQDVLTYSFFESLPAERLCLKEEEKKMCVWKFFTKISIKGTYFFCVYLDSCLKTHHSHLHIEGCHHKRRSQRYNLRNHK